MNDEALRREAEAWRKAYPGMAFNSTTNGIEPLPEPPAQCCVCSTTVGVSKDGWYGYRCHSADCTVF